MWSQVMWQLLPLATSTLKFAAALLGFVAALWTLICTARRERVTAPRRVPRTPTLSRRRRAPGPAPGRRRR
jgi:hypothetical protein